MGHPFVDEGSCEANDPEFRYEAFISYRHVQRDRKLARRIQRSIEGFRVPKRVKSRSPRLGKCFRDEDELPTTSSLPKMIESALSHSRYLIVICSPDMRESRWCAREIELFSQMRGRENVILALSSGEPADAFPLSMLPVDDALAKGSYDEPVAADFRAGTGKNFSDEVLRIVSHLVRCGYDDLKQRVRARRARRASVVAAGVAAVSLAFGGFSFYQQTQIQKNLETSLTRQSQLQAQQSMEILGQGKPSQAALVAYEALDERPYVPLARLALEKSLAPFPTDSGFKVLYANREKEGIACTAVSGDGLRYAVADYSGNLSIYSVDDGERLFSLDSAGLNVEYWSSINGMTASGDLLLVHFSGEKTIAVGFSDGLVKWSVDDGFTWSLVDSIILPVREDEIACCLSVDNDCVVSFVDSKSGVAKQTVNVDGDANASPDSRNNQFVASPTGDKVYAYLSGELVSISDDGTYLKAAACEGLKPDSLDMVVGDGTVTVASAKDGVLSVEAFDASTLEHLWTRKGDAPTSSAYEVGCLGVCMVDGTRASAAVVSSNTILYYELSTGELIRTDACSSKPLAVAESKQTLISAEGADEAGSDGKTVHRAIVTAGGGIDWSGFSSGAWDTQAESSYSTQLDSQLQSARFFTSADGSLYALVTFNGSVDSCYTAVISCQRGSDRSELPPAPDRETKGESLESCSCNGTFAAFSGESDTKGRIVEVISGETFESIHSFNIADFGFASQYPEIAFSAKLDNVLYVYDEGKICSLDTSSGKVLGVYGARQKILAPESIGGRLYPSDDGTLNVVVGNGNSYRVVALDSETLEVKHTTAMQADGGGQEQTRLLFSRAYSAGGVLFLTDSIDPCIYAVDETTGKVKQASKAGLAKYSPPVAASLNGDICMQLEDGCLKCYDASGSEKWEAAFSAGSTFSVAYLPNNNLLVEDAYGVLRLLDGATGIELTQDLQTTLPSRFGSSGVFSSGKDNRVYVKCSGNLIGIHIAEDSFGIESIIPDGDMVAKSGKSALWSEKYVLPVPETAELMQQAQSLAAIHPLSAEEHKLYGI